MGDKKDVNQNESIQEATTVETPKVETPQQVVVTPPHQPQVMRQQDNSIEGFISQAIEKGLPIETIERFLDMRRQFRADQAREAYVMAMAQFQKECPVIAKTKAVMNKDKTAVTYRYAPLDSIVLQVKDALGNNNLAYNFREERSEDGTKVTVICTIRHSMGHSEESSFTVDVGAEAYMSDTQKYGARNTFAKRYAFMNALGILTGDEDTDARELTKKAPKLNPATNKKALIISQLRKLGVKDTKDPDLVRDKIVEFTQLEPIDTNFEEITSRLAILIDEKNESN